MRMTRKNKRKLAYSLYWNEKPVYAKDKNGDIIYDDVDGELIPRITEYRNGYSDPVEFLANITFSGGESEAEMFGISNEDYDSKMVCLTGEFPINESTLIFQDSIPQYDKNGYLKRESADFRVVKCAPGLNYITYLLKRITHNG